MSGKEFGERVCTSPGPAQTQVQGDPRPLHKGQSAKEGGKV